MMKFFACGVLLIAVFTGCKKEPAEEPYVPFVYTDSVTDLEGNVYHTVEINGKVWMAENLRSTRYNNGDTIVYESYSSDWDNTPAGATCFYNNAYQASEIYGSIYNFDAVSDPRGIAPPGWHVPTYYEWLGLMTYCGNADAANRLREHGNKHWIVENGEATDEYGFCALPGGYRDFQGQFYDVRISARFWSSTHWLPSTPGYPEAWYVNIVGDKDPSLGEPEHEITNLSYVYGCYVRCVKD
jgi:uncharacterized protein (TIGR02145 family)